MEFLNLISSAEGRSLGSNASKRSSKRRANGSALGNFLEKGTRGFFSMLLIYRLAFSFRICMIYKEPNLETNGIGEVENMQNTEIQAKHYPKLNCNYNREETENKPLQCIQRRECQADQLRDPIVAPHSSQETTVFLSAFLQIYILSSRYQWQGCTGKHEVEEKLLGDVLRFYIPTFNRSSVQE